MIVLFHLVNFCSWSANHNVNSRSGNYDRVSNNRYFHSYTQHDSYLLQIVLSNEHTPGLSVAVNFK